MPRVRLLKVTHVSSNTIQYCVCNDYIAKGERDIRLHLKYAHGMENDKRSLFSYCEQCGKRVKNIYEHTIQCHRI